MLRKGARKIRYPLLAFGPGNREMRMERKLTEEERRELKIVSLAYELQDEYCDDPIEGNEYYIPTNARSIGRGCAARSRFGCFSNRQEKRNSA